MLVSEELYRYIQLVYDNNREGLLSAFENKQIFLRHKIRYDVIYTLLELHKQNPQLVIETLKSVPYNGEAQNYTTSPKFLNDLRKYVASFQGRGAFENFDWSNIHYWIGDHVGGSSMNVTTTTFETEKPATNTTYIVAAIAIILTIVLAIIMYRYFTS